MKLRCLVTAGPTYEPIDQVRRITNFSTGRLGTELARALKEAGHSVLLLRGEGATYSVKPKGIDLWLFSTTTHLSKLLEQLTQDKWDAIFHAAAVSDFTLEKIIGPKGESISIECGKIPTSHPYIFLKLVPSPKLIQKMRGWFPNAFIVGWKYEVKGDATSAITAGIEQVQRCGTNICVVNGPAYGKGYAIVNNQKLIASVSTDKELFKYLISSLSNLY